VGGGCLLKSRCSARRHLRGRVRGGGAGRSPRAGSVRLRIGEGASAAWSSGR